MKHLLIFALISAVTFSSWSQKKELKTAQKLYSKANIAEAKDILAINKNLFEGAELKIASEYHFLQSKIALDEGDYQASYDYLKMAMKNDRIELKTTEQKQLLLKSVVDTAIEQSNAKEHTESSENLYLAYLIDPENNIEYLYFAASEAVNEKSNYEKALEYYNILKEKKYEGIETSYFVTDVESGEEQEVSESEYNLYQKTKNYTNFRTTVSKSRFPGIIKNIALIYRDLGQKDKAVEAIKEARLESPKDLDLIFSEVNIYKELGENEKIKNLMIEAVAQNPNNADLQYNLGIITKELGNLDEAKLYYEKAIELNPEYENAYLGLVYLILEGEVAIVDEMNTLTNSEADTKKYNKLKEKKEALYSECIPILEKLISFSKEKKEAMELLKNIYGSIGDDKGFMKMKKMLEEIEDVE